MLVSDHRLNFVVFSKQEEDFANFKVFAAENRALRPVDEEKK